MIGFLIYLPTIIFFPHWLYLIILFFIPYKLYLNNWKIKKLTKQQIFLIIIISTIIILSLINRLIHFDKISTTSDFIPFQLLYILTIFIALDLTKTDLKIYVYLIVLEAIIGIAEYYMQVATFFPNITNAGIFDTSNDLLYYRRVFGLCSNSSTFSVKLFFGFLLIDYITINKKIKLIFQIIILAAVFCTFNRTVILAIILFVALNWNSEFLNVLKKY